MLDTTRSYLTVAESTARAETLDKISHCNRCTLAYNGNGPCRPWGPAPNDIMILGEAPTRTDDRRGQFTFSGEPGLLLRRALATAQLDLDRLFCIGAVQCWPEERLATSNLASCHPNVKALIALCDPKIVLVLGAWALRVAADRKKMTITRDHGIPFVAKAGPFRDRVVFPTWHPAALKHTKSAETLFLADIAEFARVYVDEVRG
jgi:uracil-DNA glycosylase family 4